MCMQRISTSRPAPTAPRAHSPPVYQKNWTIGATNATTIRPPTMAVYTFFLSFTCARRGAATFRDGVLRHGAGQEGREGGGGLCGSARHLICALEGALSTHLVLGGHLLALLEEGLLLVGQVRRVGGEQAGGADLLDHCRRRRHRSRGRHVHVAAERERERGGRGAIGDACSAHRDGRRGALQPSRSSTWADAAAGGRELSVG